LRPQVTNLIAATALDLKSRLAHADQGGASTSYRPMRWVDWQTGIEPRLLNPMNTRTNEMPLR
jgi:hypothetical protein